MDMFLLIIKVLSQILILLAGVWALFGPTSIVDKESKKKRLTGAGWSKLALLVVGALLFTFSQIQEAQQQSAKAALDKLEKERQAELLSIQKVQLDHLRGLLLTQHRISHLEVDIEFDQRSLRKFYERIGQPVDIEENGQRGRDHVYVSTTCRTNTMVATRRSDSTWSLVYATNRPQGFLSGQVLQNQDEWASFERAMRELMSHRFDVVAENNRVIVSLIDSPAIKQIRCTENGLRLVLRNTDIRFDDIASSKVGFVMSGVNFPTKPRSIKFSSLDPRVSWSQNFVPEWRSVSIQKIYVVDTDSETDIVDYHSALQAVTAKFTEVLTN